MPALDWADILFNAASWAAATFLVAAGLTVIFGVLHVLNFAHGALFMIGAYVSYDVITRLGGDVSIGCYLVATLAAAAVVAVLGLVIDFSVFRRMHAVNRAYVLIASYAVLLLLNGAVKLIWGVDVLTVQPPTQMMDATVVGGVVMPNYTLFTIVAALTVYAGLELMLRGTRFGQMLQAVGADPWTARMLGIDVNGVYTLTMVIGFALAGLAGGLLAANQSLSPGLGDMFVIQAFNVIIVGGMGSVTGALLAAMLLGLVNALGDVLIPNYPGALPFVALAVCLLVRPAGLLGRRETA